MNLIALVDYDNIKWIQEDKSFGDTEQNLELIADFLAKLVARDHPEVVEIRARLYGGWLDESGRFTREAEWSLALLSRIRGRRGAILLKPELALALAVRPADRLLGLMRLMPKRRRQKMVDGLMTADAIHYASTGPEVLLLLSDDDDLVPAAVAAGEQRKTSSSRAVGHSPPPCTIRLLRLREAGAALNDRLLMMCGLDIATIR